jgi:hypothetical protein
MLCFNMRDRHDAIQANFISEAVGEQLFPVLRLRKPGWQT